MHSQLLLTHERIGFWARQLRPRLTDPGLRLVETRSAADLAAALAAATDSHPLLLVDLGTRPAAGLDALDRALQAQPNALALVLDPGARDRVALLAREIGALDVLSGPVTPPQVTGRLSRWLALARGRSAAAGWLTPPPEPPEAVSEPGDWVTPLLKP